MGRTSDFCKLTWVNEWAATGDEIPERSSSIDFRSDSLQQLVRTLYRSKYTTTDEVARLRARKLAAQGLRNHYDKHGELPNAQMSTVKLVLRDVARSMSARYSKSKDEAAKPNPEA